MSSWWPWVSQGRLLEAEVERDSAETTVRAAIIKGWNLKAALANAEKRIKELDGSCTPDPWGLAKVALEADGQVEPLCLWSTRYLPAGKSQAHYDWPLFSIALSMSGQGTDEAHDLADTNMNECGRTPAGLDVEVALVHVELLGGSTDDVERIQEYGVLVLKFLNTEWELGPLGAFSWRGRRGLIRVADDREKAKTIPACVPAFGAHGLILRGNETFSVRLRFGRMISPLSEGVKVRVTLGVFPVWVEAPKGIEALPLQ